MACMILLKISIHAPRTGSDLTGAFANAAGQDFNPRSPHGERPPLLKSLIRVWSFQSTLPARGATCLSISLPSASYHFNPRSPHGERLATLPHAYKQPRISIHAPRTGSDQLYELGMLSPTQFQSTLPARGATRKLLATLSARSHFNPRSPHGERRYRAKTTAARMKHFNPRSPHGERRPRMVASSAARNFNPRSPHGERHTAAVVRLTTWYFNPRSPHGERPLNAYGITETKAFQSTLPARGATYRAKTTAARMKHFNPRSPHGERLGSLAMQLEYL